MQYCRIDRQITVIQAKLHAVVDGAQKGPLNFLVMCSFDIAS